MMESELKIPVIHLFYPWASEEFKVSRINIIVPSIVEKFIRIYERLK